MNNYFVNFRKRESFDISSFVLFAFILIAILTLHPFFKIGFTTADDLEYYMTALRGNLWQDAREYAVRSGRFYFLITKPLYSLPYLIDNFYFTKIIQYGFLILSFVLFAIVIRKILKIKEFALLAFLFLFVFLTVTPNYHIPVIAYPFFFTCSFSIFFASILFLIKYIELGRYEHLIASVIMFAIALLFYETYLIFLLFIVGFIFFRNIAERGKGVFKSKTFYKEILPFALVGILYVLVYFIYRKIVQSGGIYYDGSSVATDFSLTNFFRVLYNYNKSAVPTYIYHDFRGTIEMHSTLAGGHQHNFWYMLKNLPISMFVNTLLQCFLFLFLFSKMKNTISWKKIGISVFVIGLLTFSVHILLGISEKYNQSGYWNNVDGYVTTFYSYFCITLLIAFFMYACMKACYNIKWLRVTIIAVFTVSLFYASIIIGYSNVHLSRAWERSQDRFSIIDKVLEKDILQNIPEGAIVYAGDITHSLYDFGSGLGGRNFSWRDYIFLKTNRELDFYTNFERFRNAVEKKSEQDVYCITKYDNPKSKDILLTLSKIEKASLNIDNEENMYQYSVSSETMIYYCSPNKTFMFQFYIPDCSNDPIITIDNKQYSSNCKMNTIIIENSNNKEEITSFKLKSTQPFLIKTFMVSTIGYIDSEKITL